MKLNELQRKERETEKSLLLKMTREKCQRQSRSSIVRGHHLTSSLTLQVQV
jgi:hypothetical protein